MEVRYHLIMQQNRCCHVQMTFFSLTSVKPLLCLVYLNARSSLTVADLFFGVFLAFGMLSILLLAKLVQRISSQPSFILHFIK